MNLIKPGIFLLIAVTIVLSGCGCGVPLIPGI